MTNYILSLDQGTTSSRAIVYNQNAIPVAIAQKEFEQIFPKPGWVEHNPNEIWESQLQVAKEAIQNAGISPDQILGLGITNQRETTVVWNRETGEPVYNAIVWQDRRTSNYCEQLVNDGKEPVFAQKTGLLIDAYFSGTKIKWILDNVEGVKSLAENNELAFGTIDSWLIWKLTNGKSHITDVTNASRTLLYNIHSLKWDEELTNLLNVPVSMLPEVKESSGILANTDKVVLGAEIPVAGIAGDQQAALFGQMCIEPGMAKCTYGTGCFLVMNTGNTPTPSKNRLLTTIGWSINGQTTYALEGSVFVGGAIIQWLRDGLQFFNDSKESEALAASVNDTDGVVFVPALAGLGAPHWDSTARGAILGLTRGTSRSHITRAALESICFQVEDVLSTMAKDKGVSLTQLRIDGGATANDFMVQFQSDISQLEVVRPTDLETTALGAAYLAGLGVGLWNIDELKSKWKKDRSFTPNMKPEEVEKRLNQWLKAIDRSKNWVSNET